MSWKVLITAPAIHEVGKPALELLRAAGCEAVIPSRRGPFGPKELLELLPQVDAVLASMDTYSAEVLGSPAARDVKIISRWGVGYDAIDLAAATANGIVVTNTPGVLDEAVADYAFALLLAVARRVTEGDAAMRSGEWRARWGVDVAGKTLGIIGYGRIGRAVARRAAGFNLRVLAHSRTRDAAAEKAGVQFVPLDELLTRSDFITLHAASTPQTRGLLGADQLRRMKPTAYLINTARGALVDEPALAQALKEKWIAGAALDVFVTEPLPLDHPLRSAPNLLLSPHQGSSARETGEAIGRLAAQSIVDLATGRRPGPVVNPGVFASPALRVPSLRA